MAYQRKDAFYKKAKAAGYRSRAAYKLLERNRAWRFVQRGDRVIDLGAWPGGWLQVASAAVGPSGRVVGIDLVRLTPLPQANVHLIHGDANDPSRQREMLNVLGGPADVVLSDMAPKLSGVRETDEARAAALSRLALHNCAKLLEPGGVLFLKTFMNAERQAFVAELRAAFEKVQTTRPEATRKGSAETYVLASGYKGERRTR